MPASVKIEQYWPFCQRLLIPMAQPFLNWIGREIVRGSESFIALPLYFWRSRVLSEVTEYPARNQKMMNVKKGEPGASDVDNLNALFSTLGILGAGS